MPFNNTYTFDTLSSSEANWNFTDPVGNGLQTNNTSRRWSWHNASTTSSNVGPDGGQGGNPDGYVYTEMSSSGANGDVFIAELDVNFDASSDDITFSYYFGYRGDGNNGNIQLQSNENNTGWVNRGTAEILDQSGSSSGNPFIWLQKSVDLTGLISSNSTRFRLVITQGNAGTTWHKDVGLDTINVVGVSNQSGNFPVITLNGDSIINLEINNNYIEQGAIATDTEDGNITNSIIIGGDFVDVNTIGTYVITYTVTDSNSNTTVEDRTVNVIPPNPYEFIDDEWVTFPSTPSTWSLSGGTITQTGSGTLEGLDSITGVTLCEVAGFKVYDVGSGNLQLNITGLLFIDPEKEMLLMGYDGSLELFRVTGNGHLVIGRSIDVNGYRRHSVGHAIRFEDTGTVNSFTDRVEFVDNSRFDWFGGVISMESGKFSFLGDNVTVRIYSEEAKLIYNTAREQHQIRQETDDFISEKFVFINGDFTIVGTQQKLNGYSPIHCGGSLAWSGATPNEIVIIRNYAGGDQGNIKDCKHWSGQNCLMINSKTGSELNSGSHITGNNQSNGNYRVDKEIKVLLKTQSNNTPIGSGKLFVRDTNNGNRRLYNAEGNNFDGIPDKIYNEEFINGETNVISIRIANQFASTSFGSSNDGVNTGRYSWDYRGKQNNNSDLFDLNCWFYRYSFLQFVNAVLKGTSVKIFEGTLLQDLSITELDETIVGNYTFLDTFEKVYDSCKLWKLNNLESPDVISLPLSKEVDTITTNYDVVLNPNTNPNPFQFDGTTITLYTGSTYTGNISTTLSVDSNGVTVIGTIKDSTGSSVALSITVIDSDSGLPIPGARVYLRQPSGIILNKVTDSFGVVNELFNYTTDVVLINSRVRKGSSSPYYKTSPISGTITEDGFSAIISLNKDE